ncbi:molybdopterin-binding protein, partial [Salmonella enterica]|nr:molybdopterin-binding protein [Salmonella enterica]
MRFDLRLQRHQLRAHQLLLGVLALQRVERGLALQWAEYVGDERERITATLRRTLAGSDVVFCTGGIGATPD